MNKRKTTEEFKKQMQDINPDIEIIGKYQNNKTKISCKCKICSHEWEARPDNLLHWECPKCRLVKIGNKNRKTLEQFITQSNKVHNYKYNYDKVKYIRDDVKVTITCPIHGDFEQTPSNHLQKHGCPKCNTSKGELFIEEYLTKQNIVFKKQYCIDIPTTINPSGYAYIDFYLPDYNVFIEYNGRQHYIPIDYFGGLLNLEHQKSRDNYIKNYCKNNSYNFIEIPYTMKDEEIINTLNILLHDLGHILV